MMIPEQMGMRAKNLLLLAASFFLYQSVTIGLEQLPVTRLNIANGLSNNSVRCVYQDRKGYIWMGTYDGLNRYDGHNFTVYRNKLNDSTSLPHNYIYTLHEDKFNNLWVGTGQGVVLYDPAGFGFHQLCSKNPVTGAKQRVSASSDAIDSDQQGNVFIGTNGWGLLIKSPASELAMEASLSRFYGGIHFMDAIVNGQILGKNIASSGLKKMGLTQ